MATKDIASGIAGTSADSGPLAPRAECDTSGVSRLLGLAVLATELGARQTADEARELAARVSEGRFYVACVGQAKRGKSTLINALLGEAILPVGVVPVTTVPTVVRFGEKQSARVQTRDGSWREIAVSELEQYVSEKHNPENAKAVNGVEVFVPSPLLAAGMCLVDTPGLGSVFSGNTAATRAFTPHIDAVLAVVGADPPLAGEELAVLETISRQAPDLIVVLNKADRVTDEERAAAASFTHRLLEERLHRVVAPVLAVSAAERIQGRGPERDWSRLVEELQRLVRDSGRQLVFAACERGRRRLSEQLLVVIGEERDALTRPLEESERRVAALKAAVTDADRAIRELAFLLMAEQKHLSGIFVERHRKFLESVLPNAQQEFDKTLTAAHPGPGPSYRRRLMAGAEEIARRHVLPWLRSEQEAAEEEYRRVTARFVEMGNDFLAKLADAGMRDLARMPHALDPEAGFRTRSRFSFLDLIEVAQPASPLRWLGDFLLGLIGARRFIERDARAFLTRLIETNSTRVQSDILNRIQESRMRLEAEIRKLLLQIIRIAEEALSRARAARAAGATAVQASLDHLDRASRTLRDLGPATQAQALGSENTQKAR